PHWKNTATHKMMRWLTRWIKPHNHEIRSVARNAFQHRSGHSHQSPHIDPAEAELVEARTIKHYDLVA
ncbi:hypothetical protein AAFO90_24580, partial [Phaeobacter sp. CAU 1743]